MKQSKKQQVSSIGRNIRRERKRRDFSQEQLAEKAKISPQYLNLIENGHRCGSIATYFKIAKELDFSLSELFFVQKENINILDDDEILGLFCRTSQFERRMMVAILIAAKNVLHLHSR